jgi:DNA mismatch repair protein MutS
MSSLNESMYAQYLAWYQGHLAKYGKQTAVLMQVGKFFEIYDRLNLETNTTNTNIREIADLCSLNLSESRDPADPNLLKLFGGFPEMSLPKFEKQLLDSGYTVVVVVQKKNTKGDVEERVVERISSPGIYESRYSAGRLEDTNDSCLLGLVLEKNDIKSLYAGLAAIDIQSGQTWTTETVIPFIQGTPNIDNVEPFFLMHPPAEIVCWSKDLVTETQVRSWFKIAQSTKLHIRSELPPKSSPEFIRGAFSMKTNLQPHVALGLERSPQAFLCIQALLTFVEEHIPSLLNKLRNNSVWIPEARVRLGNAALEQLDIINSSSNNLLYWLQHTYTAIGRRNLRERILTPISDIEELEARFKRVAYLQTIEHNLEKPLRTIYDLSRIHRKLHLNTVSIIDVSHLLVSYKSISELIVNLGQTPSAIQEQEFVLDWLKNSVWSEERIKKSELNSLEKTHPYIRGMFSELDEKEDLWVNLIQEVRDFINLISDVNSPISLSMGDHQPFELVITRKRFEKLNRKDLQFHPISAKSSGGTLDSKEIQNFQKRGSAILKEWAVVQEAIWLDTITKWSQSCDIQIRGQAISEYITNWVATIDTEFCLARCANLYGYTIPKFMQSAYSSVNVKGLRHPIIERIHTMSPYVKHNVTLGEKTDEVASSKNGILIYGTNASGKSSLMKALGIAVLCAQTGIPVAASEFTISPYESIFTRILGNDNLWSALSSFAVEMTEFRAILKYANCKSLILGDELCSGTETRSATAIVSAGIQLLVKRGAQFLFATHLHEISELEEIRNLEEVQFAHLGVKYDSVLKQITYNRTLEAGTGTSLYGLEVCYGLDMDQEFLELANSCRKKTVSRYNALVEVKACSICGSNKGLESHHIKHQASAKGGFVDDGVRTHDASNLAVLCEHCHNEHHSGKLTIFGWKDTSQGRVLDFVRNKLLEKQSQEKVDHFANIQDRLKSLLGKKKKEKELLEIINAEFGLEAKIGDLREWKKRLQGLL